MYIFYKGQIKYTNYIFLFTCCHKSTEYILHLQIPSLLLFIQLSFMPFAYSHYWQASETGLNENRRYICYLYSIQHVIVINWSEVYSGVIRTEARGSYNSTID